MATVGKGKYTYELVPDWEKLPEGWVLGQTAIVTDSQDRVYLFNRGDHPLIVLDREGNFLASWGEGQLPDAHGMCPSAYTARGPIASARATFKNCSGFATVTASWRCFACRCDRAAGSCRSTTCRPIAG